jgi:hypothetical protein
MRQRQHVDMTNIEHDEIYSSMLVDKSIVYEYFRLTKNKDIDGLLSLFTDDAIVHEPFSNIAGGLQGKAAIKPFLEIAMMANSGLSHSIVIQKPYANNPNINNNNDDNAQKKHQNDGVDNNGNEISALITFERGDSIRARFTFELVPASIKFTDSIMPLKKKIQRLSIQFLV